MIVVLLASSFRNLYYFKQYNQNLHNSTYATAVRILHFLIYLRRRKISKQIKLHFPSRMRRFPVRFNFLKVACLELKRVHLKLVPV